MQQPKVLFDVASWMNPFVCCSCALRCGWALNLSFTISLSLSTRLSIHSFGFLILPWIALISNWLVSDSSLAAAGKILVKLHAFHCVAVFNTTESTSVFVSDMAWKEVAEEGVGSTKGNPVRSIPCAGC